MKNKKLKTFFFFNKVGFLFLKSLLLLVCLHSSLSYSAQGLRFEQSPPFFANGMNRHHFKDLTVQSVSGDITIRRLWTGERWLFNDHWQDLVPVYRTDLSIGSDFRRMTTSEQAYLSTEKAAAVVSYSEGGSSSGSTVSAGGQFEGAYLVLYENAPYRAERNGMNYSGEKYRNVEGMRINVEIDEESTDTNVTGYIWSRDDGSRRGFNTQGRLVWFKKPGSPIIFLVRNDAGDIETIKDAHGQELIHFFYEPIPDAEKGPYDRSDYRLIKVEDHTGRSVQYSYENAQLRSVTDVAGEVWQMNYSSDTGPLLIASEAPIPEDEGNVLPEAQTLETPDEPVVAEYSDGGLWTGFTDPEGRESKIKIDKEGRLQSFEDADGVGMQYRTGYDSDKEYYTMAMADSAGLVVETAYDELAYPTRKTINGRVVRDQVKAFLSNGEEFHTLKEITKPYRRATIVSTAASGILNNKTGSVMMIKPEVPQPYITERHIKDEQGHITVYHFNQYQEVIQIDYPDDTSRLYTYEPQLDGSRKLATLTDERGVVTQFSYGAEGRIIQIKEAVGTPLARQTDFTYDTFGQLIKMSLSSESHPQVTEWAYSYDTFGNLTSVTAPNNTDGLATGDVTQYEAYDALGNAQRVIDGRGHTWPATYDARGNVLTQLTPYAQGQSYSYDRSGFLVSMADSREDAYGLTVNASGLPTVITDSLGHKVQFEYTRANRPKALVDAVNNVYQWGYDADQRLTRMEDPLGNVTSYTYDKGLLQKVIYPTYEEHYGYDKQDRVNSIEQNQRSDAESLNATATNAPQVPLLPTTPVSIIEGLFYNTPENQLERTDGNGNITVTAWDALGRIQSVTDATGGITTYTYDNRDNVLSVTDPEGRQTLYEYDTQNRRTQEIKSLDIGSTRHMAYDYDANGNLTRYTNSKGEVNIYNYDNANRLIGIYAYSHASDANSDPARPTTANPTPPPEAVTTAQRIITYSYNTDGQFAGYADSSNSGSNDANLIQATTETRTYTQRGKLASVTTDFGSFSKTYSYTYTANGLIDSYTNPEGVTIRYSYNGNNQVTAIQLPGEGFINWDQYQWLVAQRQQIPGGTSRTNSVDALLRPQHIGINDSGDQAKLALDYSYDNASNITQRQRTIHGVIEQQESSTYGYDGEYRLTSDNRTTQIKHYDPRQNQNDTTLSDTHTYQYDGVGNRTALNRSQSNTTEASSSTTAITASVDNNNRLTQRDSDATTTANGIITNQQTQVAYTHDANGHTTSKTITTTDGQGTPLSTETTTYSYDTAQRLVKVSITTTPAGQASSTDTTAYAYNPYGQRIRKVSHTDTAQASTVHYLYTQQGLVGEYDDQGNLLVEYHYRPNSPWMTNPIYQKRDGQYYYYFNDHLGTPQQLYARSGKLVWEATYDTFGLAHINASKTTIENNLRFPGQYYDKETQLHHNYFRDYDPKTGRYIQSDPIGLDGGINTFVYVGGNPNRGIDPWGLKGFENPPITFPSGDSKVVGAAGDAIEKAIDRTAKQIIGCYNECGKSKEETIRKLSDGLGVDLPDGAKRHLSVILRACKRGIKYIDIATELGVVMATSECIVTCLLNE